MERSMVGKTEGKNDAAAGRHGCGVRGKPLYLKNNLLYSVGGQLKNKICVSRIRIIRTKALKCKNTHNVAASFEKKMPTTENQMWTFVKHNHVRIKWTCGLNSLRYIHSKELLKDGGTLPTRGSMTEGKYSQRGRGIKESCQWQSLHGIDPLTAKTFAQATLCEMWEPSTIPCLRSRELA